MWRFKFSAWAVVLLMTALSFGACDNDDDDTFVPPSNITEALKQVYPAAQNIEWEMKGAYYVADCWVSNDELEVWFDANARRRGTGMGGGHDEREQTLNQMLVEMDG